MPFDFLQTVYERAATLTDSKKTFAVYNPATGEYLADVSDMTPQDAREAVDKAKIAGQAWAQLTAQQRANALMAWRDLIMSHQEDLARLITLEMGKTLAEARGEIAYGASYISWFAEEGKRLYGDIIPTNAAGRRLLVLKQPIGVVAAITPWNFPNAMITRKLAPALAAGCGCVVKPAQDTPLSAVALFMLAEQSGLPKGLFNLVTCNDPVAVAQALCEHDDVRKLSFTGSTQVGKILMRQCADTVKRVSMELGGNAPFIVFEDTDIDQAVMGAMLGRFRNSGQTCVSANRFLIHSSVVEKFTKKLHEKVKGLTVGNGCDGQTDMGPLINMAAVDKVRSLVKSALGAGANLVTDTETDALHETFLPPMIISDITRDMDIFNAEIFGPVATILTFETEEEAIEIANDTPYGLAAYCYTNDLGRTWRMAEALEFGMVAINEGTVSSEAAPFGGIKQSGIGREGSKYGLDDYTEMKYVRLAGI